MFFVGLTHSDLTNVVQTSSGSKVPMSDKVDHSGQNYSASLRKRKLSNKTSKLCSKKKKSSVVMEPKVVDENGIQECESCGKDDAYLEGLRRASFKNNAV